MRILLGACIIILALLLYRSIRQPIRFNRERDRRVEAVTARLVDIRKAQHAFKEIHGRYTGSFDTLVAFVVTDSFEIQRKTGNYSADDMTEAEAVERGLISVSSQRISVRDSLFEQGYDLESLRRIPYSDREFVMAAGQVITPSGVIVKVFEVYALYEDFLKGLNPQLTAAYIDERERISGFPGLKVGSLAEATNDRGNWE